MGSAREANKVRIIMEIRVIYKISDFPSRNVSMYLDLEISGISSPGISLNSQDVNKHGHGHELCSNLLKSTSISIYDTKMIYLVSTYN